MFTELRKKSQITIPKHLIEKLGINEGDKLEITEKDGAIYIIPVAVLVYPKNYIKELKDEIIDIKRKIELGDSIMNLSRQDKRLIVEFLKSKLKPRFIYLFGSLARGEGRPDSDVDLAIYTDEDISPYDIFLIGNNLSFEIKRDVQIINLKDVDTVFASQIVGNREELYCEDEILKDNYNIRIFKDYAKLNEERQIILDAIERDGRVYG